MNSTSHNRHGTVSSYVAGFLLSIALSALPFFLVLLSVRSDHALIGHATLLIAIISCAVLQLMVQLVLFLHFGRGQSRWNLTAFGLMALFVCIIVAGSLWIMYNLQFRMAPQTPDQMEQYMQSQDV